MAWNAGIPIIELAQRLVDTRLRSERIKLAQKLVALEARAELRGISTKDLRKLRSALQQPLQSSPYKVDHALVLPRKPVGVWRRKYLTVKLKPGSVF